MIERLSLTSLFHHENKSLAGINAELFIHSAQSRAVPAHSQQVFNERVQETFDEYVNIQVAVELYSNASITWNSLLTAGA